MADVRTIDKSGGTGAFSTPEGRVRIELWFDDMAATADPLNAVMTPGQAMALIEQLSAAARRALTRSME